MFLEILFYPLFYPLTSIAMHGRTGLIPIGTFVLLASLIKYYFARDVLDIIEGVGLSPCEICSKTSKLKPTVLVKVIGSLIIHQSKD